MAQFNPTIQPTNDPNYGSNSRAIDVEKPIRPQGVDQNQIMPKGQEIGDRSAEFEGQAASYKMQGDAVASGAFSDLFAGIVGIGDFAAKAGVALVKKDIENRVYDVANKERQAYTEGLETIKNGRGTANVMNSNASADEPTPTEIEDLPQTLENLSGAKSSGKISNTYYYGRLLSEAKDLRARYPGFREEIDQQFAKVTGVNPANAYISALVRDLNSSSNSKNSETNKAVSFVMQNTDLPGATEKLAGIQNGTYNLRDVAAWAAPYHKQKADLQLRQLKLQDMKGTREEIEREAAGFAEQAIATEINADVQKILQESDLGSPEKVLQFDSKVKTGAITPEQFRQAGVALAERKTALKLRLIADADKSGLTQQIKGGKKGLLEIIDSNLTPLDALSDRVYNKDSGGIYQASKAIEANTSEEQRRLQTDSTVGPFFTQVEVMKKIGGEQWLSTHNLNMLQANIDTKYKNYYDTRVRAMQTQVSSVEGEPVTLNKLFEENKKKEVLDKKVSIGYINEITKISDPNVPDAIKKGLATAAFHPTNRGFISKLNLDGVDERGRPITGQFGVFYKMTSPAITSEMKRLGAKDPQMWNDYKNWVTHTFGNELFNREVNTMNKFTSDPNIKISWDSDNKRFGVVNTNASAEQIKERLSLGGEGYNTSESIANKKQYETVKQTLERLNSGISNLKNVSETSDDVDSYIFKTLIDTGLDIKDINGIPGKIANSIISSKLKKKQRE